MRRIISACMEQTLKFAEEAEYQNYIKRLERKLIHHKIVDKQTLADNSVSIKIIRDYLTYPIGDYLN